MNAQMPPFGRHMGCDGLGIANDPRNIPLVATLDLAVPLWMWELRDRTDEQRAHIARHCGAIVAKHGDDVQFGSKKPGKAAEAFNTLAEGVAAAAYQPGGITFAGRHWCTDHRQCLTAAAYADAHISDPVAAPIPTQRTVADIQLSDTVREAL